MRNVLASAVEAFQDQLAPILTPEHLAKTIADVVTDDSYSEAAYLLSWDGAQSCCLSFEPATRLVEKISNSLSRYSKGSITEPQEEKSRKSLGGEMSN